ncbi:hypothetical protein DAEQUDRAFT_765077 [Daedalea quercina L-15889]|uniref:Uncharacterized protein n=1 Tax=Daedalea quercina L-15889 TaxID=1314783 RepID=A0A165QXI0_9APHY|nr:hypothetical protein DAEQUDRAFT_765077 [Daedalea quercina L-15889]
MLFMSMLVAVAGAFAAVNLVSASPIPNQCSQNYEDGNYAASDDCHLQFGDPYRGEVSVLERYIQFGVAGDQALKLSPSKAAVSQ